MKKRVIDGVEVLGSSGNVHADLGLAAAEKLKIKTCLVIEIRKARRFGLTQQAAAKRMSITQPKVSDMMWGHFTHVCERNLMDCLNRCVWSASLGACRTLHKSIVIDRL